MGKLSVARAGHNRLSHQAQYGFTLVELVVVLLLLALVSGYALARFFTVTDYRQRSCYDELAGAVRYAQKLAVASGCDVQVDLSGNGYVLQQHSISCSSGDFTTIVNHPISSGTCPKVRLSSTPTRFIFNHKGSCSSDVNIRVGELSFAVVADTGYVDAP